jgi:Glycosyl hydrolases family 43
VEISRPTEAWEQIGTPQVNEGPEVLVHGGKAHIVYSASGSWTDDYALGMLTADLNGDLLDPKAWHKHPEPVFAKNGDVFGPGHASFTKSPDGKQDWIVYHAAKFSGGGWDRNVRIQPFGWNEDGTPSFGAPISTSEAVAMPAGEKGRIRMEAEAAKLTGMTLLKDAKASGGVMAGGWNDGEGSIAFEANAEQEGVYAMTIRYRNDTMSSAILNVNVNDEASLDWKFDNGLNGQWSNEHLSIHLNKGSNTIRFGQGLDGLSIDCIDLLLTSS